MNDPRHQRAPFLEDYVVPVCESITKDGSAKLVKLEGTAFFVGKDGIFLTAAHVLRNIEARRAETNNPFGLVVKDHNSSASIFARIQRYSYAPEPYDVAIGIIYFYSRSWFSRPSETGVEGWRDVSTLGYPETALNPAPDRFNVHLRMLKGYVQRPVSADEIPAIKPHPKCFELSFPITAGLSGSPLFQARGAASQALIGVCVGSFSAEITDYRYVSVTHDGGRFEESQKRVEQYGIAHSLEGLWNWKPEVLAGRSLSEVVEPVG